MASTTGGSSSSTSRMSSSQTLSSGLHVQSELLNEIATLRSALAQSNQQLDRAHAAGYMASGSRSLSPTAAAAMNSQSCRDRRVTMPASTSPGYNHNTATRNSNGKSSSLSKQQQQQQAMSMSISTSTAAQRHRRNSSALIDRSSSSSSSSTPSPDATNNAQSTPRSASVVGYAGAAPSSLATPTSVSVPSFTLRRDTAYEDLARVMNTASPAMAPRTSSLNNASASGLGISPTPPPPPHRRTTSMNNNNNNSGTPTSASKVTMPAFPPGMVGTATTLAGGSNSPKTPLSADKASFDGTPVRPTRQGISNKEDIPNGVLRDATNGALRNRHSDSPNEEEEQDGDKLSTSNSTLHLPLPPLPAMNGQNVPPGMLSPHLSSDGEYSPTATMESMDDEVRLPTRRQSKSSNGARGGSSPFFGGSAGFTERHAARIASSQSGTSKVIMSLQTDLTNSRTQLEHTRTQLRASARAVESLTRQIEDLKEGKERSRLELQGMSTTLTRRERMLEETLTRARNAESNLKFLEDEKKAHYGECSKKLKELENRCREAEERRAKAESEYMALRSASSNLAGGFAKEVKALKKELHSARLKSEQDRNDARTRQQSVTKLLTSRTSVQEDVTTALQDLSIWQKSMQTQYQSTINTLSAQYVQSQKDNEILTKRTQEVIDELRQYKNAMRAYDSGSRGTG